MDEFFMVLLEGGLIGGAFGVLVAFVIVLFT
jgi:hypothetical protein